MAKKYGKKTGKGSKDYDSKRNYEKKVKFDKEDSIERDMTKPGKNDVSLDIPASFMARDVASIPFNQRLGQKLDLALTVTNPSEKIDAIVPGIVNLYFTPTFGNSTSAADAINAASQGVYSFVRHANSGARNYDAPDLMLYLMRMDSIYMAMAWLARAYGAANYYDLWNMFTPAQIVRSMGIDFDDLIARQAEFRSRYNNVVRKLAAIFVPKVFPIYSRHAQMVANIYYDESDPRGQLFMYSPSTIWSFKLDKDKKGMLQAQQWIQNNSDGSAKVVTFDYYLSQIEALVAVIYEDDDVKMMSGDLLKAYGEGAGVMINYLTDVLELQPVHNIEVLCQMHHAVALGENDFTKCFVNQEISTGEAGLQGFLKTSYYTSRVIDPTFANTSKIQKYGLDATSKYLLDLPASSSGSPEEIISVTKMIPGNVHTSIEGDPDKGVTADIAIWNCGTEYVNFITVTSKQAFDLWNTGSVSKYYYLNYRDNSIEAYQSAVHMHSLKDHISWFPQYFDVFAGTDENTTCAVFTSDTVKFTVVNADTIANIHDMVVLSNFNVEELNKGSLRG